MKLAPGVRPLATLGAAGLVAEGTIEEKVMELKARKEALYGQVLDGDGLMAAEITAADVQGLFGQ